MSAALRFAIAQPQPRTLEDYLAFERNSDVRHEWYRGHVIEMAGATRYHNLIVTNGVRDLSLQLKGRPCEVYSNDKNVLLSPTARVVYPDIVVACDLIEFHDRLGD